MIAVNILFDDGTEFMTATDDDYLEDAVDTVNDQINAGQPIRGRWQGQETFRHMRINAARVKALSVDEAQP